jgi:peptide/nickel transport system permease protein
MILISFVAVTIITFYLLELAPGNFIELSMLQAQQVYGGVREGQGVTGEDPRVLMWEQRYGANTPVWKKSLIFLQHALVLDLGPSFRYPSNTIESMLLAALPHTFVLVFLSMALALVVGVPLGIISALNRNSLLDRLMMFVSMLGRTIPSYVLAVVFILVFAVKLGILPTVGWGEPRQIVLPVLSLSLGPIAGFARYMRNSLIHVLTEDYIRTGYAKGGTEHKKLLPNTKRNSLIPLITVAGPQFAFLMVGSVWIETMFNIPGLGQLFSSAAPTRDYPLVIASTGFFAVLVMSMNLLVDLGYSLLDPRIKAGYATNR